jgi:tetratricopeptide (TPR) repeat protein
MPEWIPRKIMPEIRAAIEAQDGATCIFYITGEGGGGKTILLRQVGIELSSPDGMAPSSRWSGILDLYHADVNSSSGLESHLSQALETAGQFERYRNERDAWTARREAGLIAEQLEAERTELASVFAECMNQVTDKSRTVVALDTTERIQYEVDAIQELCGLEDESTTVRAWLLDQLCRWKNCVVLLVGRPEGDPYLRQALEETLAANPRIRYQAMTLGGFDRDEARAYFEQEKAASPDLGDLDPAFWDRLWETTDGRPIRLDLAMEVIRYGLGFDQFQDKVMMGTVEEVRREIDHLLTESVMGNEPDRSVRDILRYLAVARRGLNAGLLQHLAGEWDLEACQSRLEAIAGRRFVKRHPKDERLFLHDEMYSLCDTYVLKPEQVQHLSKHIVEWYEGQIQATQDEKRRQDLRTESLLYRLRADPREGYHWYVKRADLAIRAAQVGFDMRMRSEVMAFLNSRSPVDRQLLNATPGLVEEFNCDSAAGWVKRLMIRGKNERAVTVAGMVRDAPPERRKMCPLDDPRFALARADLVVYHAQALIYTGKAQQAADLLREVTAKHEGSNLPEQLAPKEAGTYAGWRRNLALGRAHNNLGYAHWMYLYHYKAGLEEFRLALAYFRASGLREELANTNDNMGRVYALLRHPTRAETLVDEGLRLRTQLGLDYRIGLSLNSRAIVHLEFEEPHRARRLSAEALSIFERLGVQRGIGLASITLGRSLRHLGELWQVGIYPQGECEQFLSEGAKHLDRAVNVFEQVVKEPVRLPEALNELGCIHREQSRLAQETAPDRPLARASASEAIRYLERSTELAKDLELEVWYVDSCEDLAQVYFLRRGYDSTRVWLQRAEEAVPEEYKLREGEVKKEIPEEKCVEAFWLQMGKIELFQGNLAFDVGTDGGTRPATLEVLEEAARHYLLSAAYFEKFSARAVGLRATFRQMYDRFKYCPFDELQYLREKALPAVADRYAIDISRLGSFFEDTIGLAIEWTSG